MNASDARLLQLEVFADYFQFLLQDERADGDISYGWEDRGAMAVRLAVASGVVGVQTARNSVVPVTVELRDLDPEDDLDLWDHVAEASLVSPSGRVVVAGPTDHLADAPRIEVGPGSHRVRVYYSGLDSVSANRLEGNDSYRVVIWPGSPIKPRVLKSASNTDLIEDQH